MPRSERGFALLVVLWTLVLLTLLTTQYGLAGRSETHIAQNLLDNAAAQQSADGGVFEAVSHALDPAAARHWFANGTTQAISVGGNRVFVSIHQESGKINPNVAPLDLLAALMQVVGTEPSQAQQLALNIVQWRFPNPDGGPNGATAELYRAAGHDYAPPDAPFQSIDELRFVLGITPALLDQLRPHLTIYYEGDPDLQVADPVVSAAVEKARTVALPTTTDESNSVIDIHSSARTPDSAEFTRDAVVKLGRQQDGSLYKILAWR